MKRLIVIITRLCKSNAASQRDPSRPPIPLCPHRVSNQPQTFLGGGGAAGGLGGGGIGNNKTKAENPSTFPLSKENKSEKLPEQVGCIWQRVPPNLNLLCHRIIIASNQEMSPLPPARGRQYRRFLNSPYTNTSVKGQPFVFAVRRVLTAGLICLSVCV